MVNANINNAQRPADAGGFHKTVEYKQTSRHNVFESAILHNIDLSLRLIRCKIGSNCEMLVPQLKCASFRDSSDKPSRSTASFYDRYGLHVKFPRHVVQSFSRHDTEQPIRI